MLDIGWSELLLIGLVALIVVGPKDLPIMFRTLGRFTARARSMAREFQRAMDEAAKSSGIHEAMKDVKDATSKKSLGIAALENAADKFEKWSPLDPVTKAKPAPKPSPQPVLASPAAATAADKAAETTAEVAAAAKPDPFLELPPELEPRSRAAAKPRAPRKPKAQAAAPAAEPRARKPKAEVAAPSAEAAAPAPAARPRKPKAEAPAPAKPAARRRAATKSKTETGDA